VIAPVTPPTPLVVAVRCDNCGATATCRPYALFVEERAS